MAFKVKDPEGYRKKNRFGEYNMRGYLPPEKEIFEEYHNYGHAISFRKLQSILTRQGFRNPRTGNPPHVMALNYAYWRYAIRNPIESYEYAKSHPVRIEQEFIALEDWYNNLYQKINTAIYSDGQREAWLQKNKSMIEIVPNENSSGQ